MRIYRLFLLLCTAHADTIPAKHGPILLLAHQYDLFCIMPQALTRAQWPIKKSSFQYGALYLNGSAYAQIGDKDMAEVYFKKQNAMTGLIQNIAGRLSFFDIYIRVLLDKYQDQ